MIHRGIVLFLLLLRFFATHAQESLIVGKVFDGRKRTALEGAAVNVVGSTQGTTTDGQGHFKLMTKHPIDSIVVSFLGYESKILAVSGTQKDYNIALTPSSETLNQVVVAAFEDQEHVLKTPGSLSVLADDQLSYSNQVAVIPALNRVPGVFIHSGTYTTNRITIRGIGARSPYSTTRIKVYFNDIPITSGEGVTTMEDIELSSIGEIEVIKGPVSSIYGAGLGGVLLITPRKVSYESTHFEQQTILGSFGLIKSATTIASNTAKANLLVNYSRIHSDGFRENNGYDRHTLTGNWQFFPGEKDIITFFTSYSKVKAFIPSSIDSATFYKNPRSAAESWKESKGYEGYHKLITGITNAYTLSKGLENNTSVFLKYFNNYEPRPFNILKEDQISYGLRSVFHYNHPFGSVKSHWALGTEVYNEWLDWQIFENVDRAQGNRINRFKERRFYYNIFSRINFDFATGTTVSTGLNFNQTSYEISDRFAQDSIDQSGSYVYDPIFSPFVGLSQMLNPSNAVFVTVSHGFAPPTVEETLSPEGQINPDIVPEKGFNIEAGLRGTLLNDKLEYNLSGYFMRIKDKLVAERVGPDDYIGVNAGSTVHSGVEVAVIYDLIDRKENLCWFINYAFGHYRFKEFVEEGHDYSGNELTGTTPHHLDTKLLLQTRWGLYAYLNYQFVDRIPMLDDNSKYSSAYHLLHGKVGFQQTFLGQFKVDIYFGINNINDTHYASMILVNAEAFGGGAPRFYYPGAPRNYYGGLSIKYILQKEKH